MSEKIYNTSELKSLLAPDSIAVIGASKHIGPGRQVIENLMEMGYKGRIYPVNPRYKEILGLPCYSSLTEISQSGQRVEMVAILLGRSMIIPILKEAASIGVRAGWAFASGFGEAGPEGRALQNELTNICKKNNIMFCGPNCVGYLRPEGGIGIYSAPIPVSIRKGNIGMIAQSGYLTIAVANSHRGLGFSMLCSSGNEAVLDSTDFISYMLEDPSTKVIMAFIEQFRKPKRLQELAERALEVGKPIIMIKVGRSEMARKATVAHTGALAGSDDVQDALFKKIGIIRVDDLNEMFETAEIFSKFYQRLPKGDGIYSVSLSGGVISLIGDLGENLGLKYPDWSENGKKMLRNELPSYIGINNPLDAWGYGKIEETYEPCLMAASREEKADLIYVTQDVPPGMSPRQVDQYAAVARAAVNVFKKSGKPIVMVSNPSVGFHPDISRILKKGKIPLLQGTREGLKAAKSLISYASFKRKKKLERKYRESDEAILSKTAAYLHSDQPVLTEYVSKKILNTYGIRCTPEVLCKSVNEAIKAARNIRYPIVMKVISPQIQHKTEAGIIKLNVRDEDEVERAYEELLKNAQTYDPFALIDGILCQRMIEGAVVEAIVGILMDPDFGPSVVFGLGGVMVEILQDRSIGIPPLTHNEALEMIEETKGCKLLAGFRGSPKADIEALTDTLVRVGRLAVDWDDRIEALDINPLLVMPEGQGVFAVDALLEVKKDS